MATTTNRNLHTGIPPQPHRRYHVLGPSTANNQGRVLVHQTVMDSANLVVARISRRHHRTNESRPQLLYLRHRPHTHAPSFPETTSALGPSRCRDHRSRPTSRQARLPQGSFRITAADRCSLSRQTVPGG